MNNDVIRICKSDKELIEKLIPAMKEKYKNDVLSDMHNKILDDRDYSSILNYLIIEASRSLGVNLF